MGKQSIAAVAGIAFWAATLAAPRVASAAQPPSVVSCAKRVTNGAKGFVTKYFEWITDCEIDNLGSDAGEKLDCRAEAAGSNTIEGLLDKFFREVDECASDAFRAICPFEAKNAEELKGKLGAPGGIVDQLLALSDDIYVTDYGAGCERPPGEATRDAEECGKQIARVGADYTEELVKCVFKCELGRLRESSESVACLDPSSGAPVREKVVECFEGESGDFHDDTDNKCKLNAHVLGLGCPMGFETVPDVLDAIDERIVAIVAEVDESIFRSPCKSSLEDAGEDVAIPANVTLEPSFTTKQVACGQILNASFFGSDTTVRFDSNLDCTPIGTATDGVVISKSGVTVSGRGEYRITGPQSKKNRTGAGIRLASGVTGVRIQGFSAIERFADGIGDAGNNTGLVIDNVTVRRNEAAGIRLTSPGAAIEEVKADRNTIGFDLSGDNTTLTESRALRSTAGVGIGVRLDGVDTDGNGRIVWVRESASEENLIGLQLNGGPHRIEHNSVRENLGTGIHVASIGSKVDSNSIKLNLTDGVWVTGSNNDVSANSSDENVEDGYVVEGSNNLLDTNRSGTLTDNGNGGVGYRIGGMGNRFRSNKAEANLGAGFLVGAPTAVFTSNNSNRNHAQGYLFTSGGSTLDTNKAEFNTGFEFVIAPGNTDAQSNTANGAAFSFGAGGGSFE
ncbi:MAG: right-handed parallel beta-helix repeat-containing protein [Deltaproteobacteria bacterium]|nr:right-handed parallel beta-helix repeat-containing protein [Deltaproteobacteria bacterium]